MSARIDFLVNGKPAPVSADPGMPYELHTDFSPHIYPHPIKREGASAPQ